MLTNIQAFIGGDEKALEQLMDEMEAPLMKYCYNILLNASDAEDAVQNAFVKAYYSRQSLKNPEAFPAWLYRVAYTSSMDIVRKRRLMFFSEAPARTDKGYLSPRMRAALERLSPIDRAVVYGRAVEERSYAELADIHGKSEQALRKRYERAKKKLAGLLTCEERGRIEMV